MVDWRFLCKYLEAFGFNKTWLNLIFECISSPKIYVIVNGSLEGYFDISRGLRQGDPISPFLFIIMAEALGRTIQIAQDLGKISGVKITSNLPSVTHQQFADNTLLFGESSLQEARNFNLILEWYSRASEQVVNKEKSNLYFFNTNSNRERAITNMLGFNRGSLSRKYLGLPLEKGIRSSNLWGYVLSKLDRKLQY